METQSSQVEVERKFVLAGFPSHLKYQGGIRFRQAYLSPPKAAISVRIRQEGSRRILTIKKGLGLRRFEEEIVISAQKFESLWSLTEGARVSKTRYVVDFEDLAVEIDVFHDEHAPLVLAEVEIPPGASFIGRRLPEWIGTEVTGLVEFTNSSLAHAGLPPQLAEFTPKTESFSPITHAGALPYRLKNGSLEILCISSQDGQSWTAPGKMWDTDSDLDDVAARAALEEAGAAGILDPEPLGIYEDTENERETRTELFALKVEEIKTTRPKGDVRERKWIDINEAPSGVLNIGINRMIMELRSRISD